MIFLAITVGSKLVFYTMLEPAVTNKGRVPSNSSGIESISECFTFIALVYE